MLTSENIITTRNARVFSQLHNDASNEVWLLFHGYAQNINEFFEPFQAYNHYNFIVPEGLSRFYQKGIMGIVGASWMTKEYRDFEIDDQLNFLNSIYDKYDLVNKTLNIFAFSQGAAVAARWIEKEKIKVNRLVFWSGKIPDEIGDDHKNELFKNNPEFYFGSDDQFASEKTWNRYLSKLPETKKQLYKGDHFFTENLLKQYIFTK